MGSFAALLGHAAGGFEQARQDDLQRQFTDEQNRRSMAGELLQKIALDENQHPEVRNAAMQAYGNVVQDNKPGSFKMGKTFEPLFNLMAQKNAQAKQAAATTAPPPPPALQQLGPNPVAASTPGLTALGPAAPPPPGGIGPVQQPQQSVTPPPSLTASQQMMGLGQPQANQPYSGPPVPQSAPPAPPQGLLASSGEVTQNLANRAAATSAAPLAAQIGVRQQALESGANPLTLGIPGYANMAARPFVSGEGYAGQLRAMGEQVPLNIPDEQWVNSKQLVGGAKSWEPAVAPGLKATGNGDQMINPAMMSKTTSSSSTSAGGLTSTNKKTVTPNIPGGGPPAPPSTGGSAPKSSAPSGRTIPPAVSAAMDSIMMYGMPEGKMGDAQALAIAEMKKEGIDPAIAATSATRTMADKGRAILPLIAKARQLIAQDPEALGPLQGRWSELTQKAGNLHGPAKELAGTLVSIYSMAGGMHGWRALKVADEFRNTYGDLSNDPQSLNNGLDALAGTAASIIHTAYPGGGASGGPPPPPAAQVPFNWNAHPVIQ